MESFVRNFIRASLVWLGVGVSLGLALAWVPGHALAYRPAHVHANVLGFVSMMIFGVAYHVIPRFSGAPLRSRGLARAHLWLANLGLAGMVAGWVVRVHLRGPGAGLLGVGGALAGAGAACFIYNIWCTVGSTKRPGLTAIRP